MNDVVINEIDEIFVHRCKKYHLKGFEGTNCALTATNLNSDKTFCSTSSDRETCLKELEEIIKDIITDAEAR